MGTPKGPCPQALLPEKKVLPEDLKVLKGIDRLHGSFYGGLYPV